MEYKIQIGEQEITLFHDNMDASINVDDLTKIDVGNIYGDAVTISSAVNRIGLIKAEVEALMGDTRLEKALETCFETDLEWIALKRKFITAEKNFNSLSSLYWACQDKSRKLNSLVNGVTPKEFVEEMIQGKVNGILIKK